MYYTSQLGWRNSVLCHHYYQGLSNWIQDPISTWELFQDMYVLAMTINYHYWERDCKCYHARQAEKEALESHSRKQGKASTSSSATTPQNKANSSPVASSAKNPFSKSSPSPTPKKQPNTPQVDFSSKLASNSKLTSDKYKKRLKNNLCLYSPIPRSRPQSFPRVTVLQQLLILQLLLPRNPWKNRE